MKVLLIIRTVASYEGACLMPVDRPGLAWLAWDWGLPSYQNATPCRSLSAFSFTVAVCEVRRRTRRLPGRRFQCNYIPTCNNTRRKSKTLNNQQHKKGRRSGLGRCSAELRRPETQREKTNATLQQGKAPLKRTKRAQKERQLQPPPFGTELSDFLLGSE